MRFCSGPAPCRHRSGSSKSGPSDPRWQLAADEDVEQELARRERANVLRLDDRGVGGSGGDVNGTAEESKAGKRTKAAPANTPAINTAIDEKSPYTGGHCKRVPTLTMMLAEAAHAHERMEQNQNFGKIVLSV